MKAAFPRAAFTFGWYANNTHYQAVPPQDHTPFSATGWPVASPKYWVFATDVMHRPDLGVDCGVLFPYWLAEAKAGRMPWLKYLIWQATIYDVRNNWQPQASSEHFDHIHLSARTDYQLKGLGGWSVIQEDDMPKFWRAPNGACGSTNGPWRFGYSNVEELDAALGLWGLDRRALVPVALERVPALGELANGVGHDQVVLTPEQIAELAHDIAEAVHLSNTDVVGAVVDALSDNLGESK